MKRWQQLGSVAGVLLLGAGCYLLGRRDGAAHGHLFSLHLSSSAAIAVRGGHPEMVLSMAEKVMDREVQALAESEGLAGVVKAAQELKPLGWWRYHVRPVFGVLAEYTTLYPEAKLSEGTLGEVKNWTATSSGKAQN